MGEFLTAMDAILKRQRELCPETAVRRPEVSCGTSGLSRAVHDCYRCPEEFVDFLRAGQLSLDKGYFRFGPNAICYGRSCLGVRRARPDSTLYDTFGDVIVEDAQIGLPFDADEIIDNLRLERYAAIRGIETSLQNLLRRLYYHFRPLTTQRLRKQVQRFHARNWRTQTFPKWPVDTTVEEISETLLLMSMEAKGVKKVPFVWFWPDGASACLTMTHDVETRTGRDRCADLMDVDDSFGIKAAFGIVPEERYEIPSGFLELIRRRGFEVAIQDFNHDGRLFDNKGEFLRRVKFINHYAGEYGAKGFRAGVLYRRPEWYDALELSFDMSIPNVAHLDPQHGGCCTVMPYFIGDLLELPVTTIQDYTLFHVLNERSIDLWKSQIDLILMRNGLMSFIVHPDYVMDEDHLPLYEGLLAYLRAVRGAIPIWCALPADVDSWCRARSRMSVVRDGHSWRIEGDDSGRAVLAYAQNIGGKLSYELASAPGNSPNRLPESDSSSI